MCHYQIWVVLFLIGWKFASTNQKHYPDLDSDTSQVWNFLHPFLRRHFAGNLVVVSRNSWFATTWQGGHVRGVNTIVFSRRISMKTEFGSQRWEMLLFLTANMAAVTSHANLQYWLFSQDSRSYMKLGNGEGERGTGKMKNGTWLGFFRVPVLPWSFPVPLSLFSSLATSWDEEVGESRKGEKKRRAGK